MPKSKPKRTRANRELATRRAFAMWNRLLQGEASKQELIRAVQNECVKSPYGANADDSFDKDKRFLDSLDVKIRYDKGANVYRLESRTHPFLRLPLTPEELELLPLIENAFHKTPYGERVAQLMKTLTAHLSAEQVALQRSQPLLSIVLTEGDTQAPDLETLTRLAHAIRLNRRIEFDYIAPPRQEPMHHIVEVYESLEYREGHVYFEGRNVQLDTEISYRADRIVKGTLRQLPAKFAKGARREEWLPLRYKLTAKVAGQGASRRFPEHREEKLADGAVMVRAKVSKRKLWWASKTLLKYGENCIVLEPKELADEMKRVVGEMAENYGQVVI